MKMPWTKAIEAVEKKMQNTIDRISHVITTMDQATHEKSMAQLNIIKKSQQIKYNRVETRLIELETCFKGELEHYRKTLEMKERAAATDAEKASL